MEWDAITCLKLLTRWGGRRRRRCDQGNHLRLQFGLLPYSSHNNPLKLTDRRVQLLPNSSIPTYAMKRPRDMFDTPISSPPFPSKRRFLSQSMAPSSSPSTSRSTPYTLPRQPSCSPWALATPHDSPSNPFGLNRSLRALTLPRPSGFGKHIVLRLQLVSTVDAPRSRGGPSRRYTDAPFRIVQLPLNFSFRLLHMLILFVFASDARLLATRKRRVFSPPSPIGRKNKGKTRSKKGGKANEQDENEDQEGNEEGHLFEVLNDISICSMAGMRPGQIREGTGKLYARLSSARERKLFSDPDDGGDEDDVFAGASVKHTTPLAEVEKDAEEGWVWEAEDDFMLSNVWSDGLDLKKGIIYVSLIPSYPLVSMWDRTQCLFIWAYSIIHHQHSSTSL